MFYLKYIRHAYVSAISQVKSPFPVGSSTNSLATSHRYLSLGPLMHPAVPHLWLYYAHSLLLALYFPIICLETPPGP